MYNGQIIKDLAEKRKLNHKDIYDAIHMSRNTFERALKYDGNPTASTMEPIVEFLGISMDDLFIRKKPYTAITNINSNAAEPMLDYSILKMENIHLKKMLEEKERTIKLLIEQSKKK